jgi:hypothetical protein
MNDRATLQKRIAEVRRRVHKLRNELQALESAVDLGEWDMAKVHGKSVNRALQKLALALELLEPS